MFTICDNLINKLTERPETMNICRCCQGFTLCYRNLHSNKENVKIIRDLTGLIVKHNDGLPENLCKSCVKNLHAFASFRKIILQSDLHFKNQAILHLEETATNSTESLNYFNEEPREEPMIILPLDTKSSLENDPLCDSSEILKTDVSTNMQESSAEKQSTSTDPLEFEDLALIPSNLDNAINLPDVKIEDDINIEEHVIVVQKNEEDFSETSTFNICTDLKRKSNPIVSATRSEPFAKKQKVLTSKTLQTSSKGTKKPFDDKQVQDRSKQDNNPVIRRINTHYSKILIKENIEIGGSNPKIKTFSDSATQTAPDTDITVDPETETVEASKGETLDEVPNESSKRKRPLSLNKSQLAFNLLPTLSRFSKVGPKSEELRKYLEKHNLISSSIGKCRIQRIAHPSLTTVIKTKNIVRNERSKLINVGKEKFLLIVKYSGCPTDVEIAELKQITEKDVEEIEIFLIEMYPIQKLKEDMTRKEWLLYRMHKCTRSGMSVSKHKRKQNKRKQLEIDIYQAVENFQSDRNDLSKTEAEIELKKEGPSAGEDVFSTIEEEIEEELEKVEDDSDETVLNKIKEEMMFWDFNEIQQCKVINLGYTFCNVCDLAVTNDAYDKHHEKHSKFYCRMCDLGFIHRKFYNNHLRELHPEKTDDLNLVCEICAERFTLLNHLQKHQHLKCKPKYKSMKRDHLCNVCGKILRNTTRLKYHIQVVHGKQKPLKCQKCGRSFGLQRYLNNHMKQHSDEKRYKCPICPLAFKHNISKKNHMYKYHI